MTYPRPTATDAARVFERLYGAAAEDITAFDAPRRGSDGYGYRCVADGQSMYLKISKNEDDPVGLYYHTRLAEAGVPVPEMIAQSEDAGPAGQGCALYEWVDGARADFTCDERPPYDEAQMGQILRRIHDLKPERGWGRVDDRGIAPATSWAEALADVTPVEACVKRAALDAETAAQVREAFAGRREELNAVSAGLTHWEDIMHSGNVMVDNNGRIVAVLDFDGARAADPVYEMMWFDYYYGEYGFFERTPESFDLTKFRDGYGVTHDPHSPLQKLYLLSGLVLKLSWLPLDGARAESHRVHVQELVADLGG